MKKRFNITGTCYPEYHYMMDNSRQVNAIQERVEQGDYFTINRPRQYGKTTSIYHLQLRLEQTEEYLSIFMSFQGIDGMSYESDAAFAQMFIEELRYFFEYDNKEIHAFIQAHIHEVKSMSALSKFITRFMHHVQKKVVLLIDEVDASSNYYPFLSFLGMLRQKYLERLRPRQRTFHSIVLVGVHDVKNLKYKLRNPEEAQYNSPWNIAVDFDVDMRFNQREISVMLQEYSEVEAVEMDIPVIAEWLYYYTSGYPFLVSRLCKMIVDKILPNRTDKKWTVEDVANSTQLLIRENNPNFENLIKHLQNHQDLYDLVYRLIINGERLSFNTDNVAIQKGVMYGVFKLNGKLKIHNRIYEQRIYNFLISNTEINLGITKNKHRSQFLLPNNELNLKKVLLKFQQFIKEQYSNRDRNFLEREWRLLFLAFIQPILNGEGYAFKEPQFEQEKQLDVVITYYQHRYIIELKKWYGLAYHEAGIQQLANYLNIQGMPTGFLIIFDDRKKKTYIEKSIKEQGKEIFAIWI